MPASRSRQIFVNLPVRDLDRSMAFFAALGFAFDLQFTDATAACMVLSEQGWVMLLTDARFQDAVKKASCDTTRAAETLIALSAESRAEVDELVDTALAAGASPAVPPTDSGVMYGRSFYDLDGHHWEFFYMDASADRP